MNTVRWGILGTARIAAQQVIPGLQEALSAQVTAVASRDSARGRQFAAQHNIGTVYGSYEELLRDPAVDAVYIPLPNHLHAEWTIKAAEHGKHVLCEKPMARTTAESITMIDACRRHGVLFLEAFMYQFHPQWARVQELLADGEIGSVRVVDSRFSFRLKDSSDIRMNPAMGGGALYDVGTYCVHASRLVMGTEPIAASAQAYSPNADNVDTTLSATLAFSGERFAHFHCSFDASDEQSVAIYGTLGKIIVTLPFRPDKGTPELRVEGKSGVRTHSFEPESVYALQAAYMSDLILAEQKSNLYEDRSLGQMRALDRLYASCTWINQE